MSSPKPPRGERTVTVLDVGTSKVAAMIALIGAGEPRVIGVGQRVCQGVRRGLVADMEKTESAIRAAVDQAERNAGVQAGSVYVNMSAGSLRSEVETVEIDIGGHKISAADMSTLLDAGRARIDPGSRTVLHAQPALYAVDGTFVEQPVGFHADRLGMDIHIVTADTPPIRNLDLAVRSAHLGVRTMVASPAASSLAVLAQEERDLGVALVEIGAGVTNIAVHMMGQLVGVASVAMGAGDITNDIASAFATRRSHAERLKTLYGAAITAQKDNHDLIEIPPISDDEAAEAVRVSRAQIIGVVRHRLDLLFGEGRGAVAAARLRRTAGAAGGDHRRRGRDQVARRLRARRPRPQRPHRQAARADRAARRTGGSGVRDAGGTRAVRGRGPARPVERRAGGGRRETGAEKRRAVATNGG